MAPKTRGWVTIRSIFDQELNVSGETIVLANPSSPSALIVSTVSGDKLHGGPLRIPQRVAIGICSALLTSTEFSNNK
jgi:hypothetical protein